MLITSNNVELPCFIHSVCKVLCGCMVKFIAKKVCATVSTFLVIGYILHQLIFQDSVNVNSRQFLTIQLSRSSVTTEYFP